MTTAIGRTDLGDLARSVGLHVLGVTSAEPFHAVAEFLVEHIALGHVVGLPWFTADRARESCDPRTLHPDPRAIISVAVPYWTGHVAPPDDGILRGRIARYAWGADYHRTLRRRMRAFVAALEDALARPVISRTLVDTARIVDRAAAARAGVGWYGKNSLVIVPGHGSWVMLGEIIVDIELQPDLPLVQDCGRCTFCLDRCPTNAIIAPYRVHTPRCISFLTIEERGPIPAELRAALGAWVFGCDICQDVCPYTAAAHVTNDPDFRPAGIENVFPSLERIVQMTEAEFRATYSGTAVSRAKRRGLARNAAIALGNTGSNAAEPILLNTLRNHDEPLVRGHAAWAFAQLTGGGAGRHLEAAWRIEQDEYVRAEIVAARAA